MADELPQSRGALPLEWGPVGGARRALQTGSGWTLCPLGQDLMIEEPGQGGDFMAKDPCDSGWTLHSTHGAGNTGSYAPRFIA